MPERTHPYMLAYSAPRSFEEQFKAAVRDCRERFESAVTTALVGPRFMIEPIVELESMQVDVLKCRLEFLKGESRIAPLVLHGRIDCIRKPGPAVVYLAHDDLHAVETWKNMRFYVSKLGIRLPEKTEDTLPHAVLLQSTEPEMAGTCRAIFCRAGFPPEVRLDRIELLKITEEGYLPEWAVQL